jgi:hypothetical protein
MSKSHSDQMLHFEPEFTVSDEYGTIAQCQAIERGIGPLASTLMLEDCGHAPHNDQRERVMSAMTAHIRNIVS